MRNIFIFFTSIISLTAVLIMFLKESLLALFIALSGLFVSALIYIFFQEHRPIGLLPILAPNPIYDEFPRSLRPHA